MFNKKDLAELIKDSLENNYADKLHSALNSFVDDIDNVNISGKKSKVNEVLWASADIVEDVYDVDGEINGDCTYEANASISAYITVGDRLADSRIEDSVNLCFEIKVQGGISEGSDDTYDLSVTDIEILNQIQEF